MTFVVTSEVDHPQPGYEDGMPLSSLTAAAEHVTANCLADTPIGLVGLELEAHCFDVADPTRRPGWRELCDIIKSASDPPCGSRITVEPGGAVELSTPPVRGVVAAIDALMADRAALRTVFAQGRVGSGVARCGSVAATPPRQSRPPLSGDGAVFPPRTLPRQVPR